MSWIAELREWDLGAADETRIVELRAHNEESALDEAHARVLHQPGVSVVRVGKVEWTLDRPRTQPHNSPR